MRGKSRHAVLACAFLAAGVVVGLPQFVGAARAATPVEDLPAVAFDPPIVGGGCPCFARDGDCPRGGACGVNCPCAGLAAAKPRVAAPAPVTYYYQPRPMFYPAFAPMNFGGGSCGSGGCR